MLKCEYIPDLQCLEGKHGKVKKKTGKKYKEKLNVSIKNLEKKKTLIDYEIKMEYNDATLILKFYLFFWASKIFIGVVKMSNPLA